MFRSWAKTLGVVGAVGFVAAIGGVALIGPVGALLALPIVATVQSFLVVYVPRHDIVKDDLLLDEGGPTAEAT